MNASLHNKLIIDEMGLGCANAVQLTAELLLQYGEVQSCCEARIVGRITTSEGQDLLRSRRSSTFVPTACASIL